MPLSREELEELKRRRTAPPPPAPQKEERLRKLEQIVKPRPGPTDVLKTGAVELLGGLTKGVAWPVKRWVGPRVDEIVARQKAESGLDIPYLEGFGEIVGSFVPITGAMSVARWMRGAVGLGHGLAARMASTAAVGAAGSVGAGESPLVGAAIFGGGEAVVPVARKALTMAGRTEAYNKLVETLAKGAERVRVPSKALQEKWGAANLREMLEPAIQRMDAPTQRVFRKYYTRRAAAGADAQGWFDFYARNLSSQESELGFKLATVKDKGVVRQELKNTLAPERVRAVSKAVGEYRRRMIRWGRAATEAEMKNAEGEMVSLLRKETFRKNIGTYTAQLFEKYEDPALKKLVEDFTRRGGEKQFKALKVGLERFMQRHDLPPSILEDLKHITDIGFVGYKGLMDTSRSVLTANLFSHLQKMRHSLEPEVYAEGVVAKLINPKEYLRIPNEETFGALRNTFVKRPVAQEVLQFMRHDDAYQRFLAKWVNRWKVGKTLFNPPAQFRNVMSNTVLNHLGGLPMWRADIYAQAAKEYASKGALYRLAVDKGALGGTWFGNEARPIMDYFAKGKVGKVLAKTERTAGSLYQGTEQYFKLAKFIHNMKRGLNPNDAAQDAVKWTFNYNEVTPFVKHVSRSVMPFVTFTYKSLPRMAESMIVAPWRMGSLMLAMGAAGAAATNALGMTESEAEDLFRRMPEHIKSGKFLLMPVRDERGRMQWLDMTYILPWGDVAEVGDRRFAFFFQNPLLQLYSDISHGEDFAGRPVYYDWEPYRDKVLKSMRHTLNMVMPGAWYQLIRARQAGVLPGDFASTFLGESEAEADWAPTKDQWLASQFGLKTWARTPAQIRTSWVKRKEAQERDILSKLASMQRPGGRKSEIPKALKALRENWQLE